MEVKLQLNSVFVTFCGLGEKTVILKLLKSLQELAESFMGLANNWMFLTRLIGLHKCEIPNV